MSKEIKQRAGASVVFALFLVAGFIVTHFAFAM